VTIWFVASAVLLLGMGLCLVGTLHGEAVDRLVALELTGIVSALTLLTLAEAFGRGIYADPAVALALVSFPGGLVFARFLERWR
jgi:multicomponent Na+:H+ antiporter subunit F